MIICIGNALVDSLQQIEEDVIDKLNLNKARMTLVDKERSNFLLSNMPNPTYAAGGSAANTAYWIAALGGSVGFIGKISDDEIKIRILRIHMSLLNYKCSKRTFFVLHQKDQL